MPSVLTQSTLQTPIYPSKIQGWAADTKAQTSGSKKVWQGVSSSLDCNNLFIFSENLSNTRQV